MTNETKAIKATDIYQALRKVQQELKAPKTEASHFGKHRNVEGILEALKPLLGNAGLTLILDSRLVEVGGRNYVEATARVFNEAGDWVEAHSQAWEGELSRGLAAPQVTGSASSYARKYALGGLFAIDDSKDPDSHMAEPERTRTAPAAKPQTDIDPATPAQKQQLKNMMLALDMDKDAMEMHVQIVLDKPTVDSYADFKKVLESLKGSEE